MGQSILPQNSLPKNQKPINRHKAQPNRHGLASLNSPRNRASTQDNRGQETQLITVGLARAKTLETVEIEGADGETGCDGGDGAGACIADYSAEGGEDGEGEGGVDFEGLFYLCLLLVWLRGRGCVGVGGRGPF